MNVLRVELPPEPGVGAQVSPVGFSGRWYVREPDGMWYSGSGFGYDWSSLLREFPGGVVVEVP